MKKLKNYKLKQLNKKIKTIYKDGEKNVKCDETKFQK